MALACFQDVRLFVCSISVLLFVDMIAIVYFRSALTTIERRFELSTTSVAMIATAYQIGNLAVMAFVSFYGSRTNRPRFIGLGSTLIAIGFLTASLPQFLDSRYEYVDTMKNATSANNKQVEMCEINDTKTTEDVSCETNENEPPRNNLYILILVGMTLAGIGSAPLQPLGMSYIDDHSSRRKSPVYIGIVMTVTLIGPAFGFLLGALILTLWVDFAWVDVGEVTIQPTNPSWVGAWWLGFLLSGILILIATIPFYFFPKKIKIPDEDKKSEHPLYTGDGKNKEDDEVKDGGGFLKALKRIATNGVFMLLIALWMFNGIKVIGVLTFFPKFLEVQFGVSAAKANMYFGAIGIPCLAVGTMFGSYLMKRYNPNRVGMLKILVVSNILTAVLTIPMLLLGCETTDIAGITIPYSDSADDQTFFKGNSISACNSGCGCTEGTFSPICGSDGVTYISPCHAGCNGTFSSVAGTIQNYTGCRCINTQNEDILDVAHWSYPHSCSPSKCPHLVIVYLILIAATNLFGGASATPSYIFLMRTVDQKDKAFAIGVAIMIVRILAWIPGPLLYGKVIDSTCLYWAKSSCSGKGYCRVYDSSAFRMSFYSIVTAAEIATMCFAIALYIIVKRSYRKECDKYDDNDNTKQREVEVLLTGPNFSIRVAARLASESFSCSTDELGKDEREQSSETEATKLNT